MFSIGPKIGYSFFSDFQGVLLKSGSGYRWCMMKQGGQKLRIAFESWTCWVGYDGAEKALISFCFSLYCLGISEFLQQLINFLQQVSDKPYDRHYVVFPTWPETVGRTA